MGVSPLHQPLIHDTRGCSDTRLQKGRAEVGYRSSDITRLQVLENRLQDPGVGIESIAAPGVKISPIGQNREHCEWWIGVIADHTVCTKPDRSPGQFDRLLRAEPGMPGGIAGQILTLEISPWTQHRCQFDGTPTSLVSETVPPVIQIRGEYWWLVPPDDSDTALHTPRSDTPLRVLPTRLNWQATLHLTRNQARNRAIPPPRPMAACPPQATTQ